MLGDMQRNLFSVDSYAFIRMNSRKNKAHTSNLDFTDIIVHAEANIDA